MSQSELLAITCNLLKAREKLLVHGAIGFASLWLKNWREVFKPIPKRNNCNHVITFDRHLKTAPSSQIEFIQGLNSQALVVECGCSL